MQDPHSSPWRIVSGAVGTLALGKPLPDVLLTSDLEGRYIARLVADGQPFEGFRYDDPPLTAGIADGPFAAAGDETPPDAFRSPAAAAARNGALVNVIRVHGPAPITEAGAGVGSTLSRLRTAYADLSHHAVPPTLGNDRCVATSSSLPDVYFIFASCDGADPEVVRVDLWSSTSDH